MSYEVSAERETGTETRYAAIRARGQSKQRPRSSGPNPWYGPPIMSRVCYGMPGTEIRDAAIPFSLNLKMPGTDAG
eukprot:303852-Rhodomonas_salina.6